MTKSINIKNALVRDKEYLDNLALSLNLTIAEALSELVNIAKRSEKTTENHKENSEETGKLETENQRLTIEVQRLSEENISLTNKEPQTIEKTVEVEMKLTGSQFICDLEEKIAYNARKVRKFAIKDGLVTGENYPNELANAAIKQFINREYIDLIDWKPLIKKTTEI